MVNKKRFCVTFILISLLIGLFSLFIYRYIQYKNYNNARAEFIQTQSGKQYSIAVLAIALGRYDVFWKEFYESGEKYFFPGQDVQYYLFTDSQDVVYKDAPNVHIIPTRSMKWPEPTLLRYDIFLSQKEELKKYDYLYFFNMDSAFKDFVGEEILPKEDNDGLVFAQHCQFYKYMESSEFPYERNPKSMAYVPYGKEGRYYVPGGLNGGTTKSFLALSEYCSKNAHKDIENNIIPTWHDEAYTNKYILGKNPLILPLIYMRPLEPWCISTECANKAKIELRPKIQYGGRYYLRGFSDIKSTPYTRLKYKILIHGIIFRDFLSFFFVGGIIIIIFILNKFRTRISCIWS